MIKKYLSFFGLCLGFFIIMMDTTSVPLTYTTLMSVFHVNPAMVAWINNIYLITYAAFLLLGGRLGDGTNRKIIVLIAYAVLGVGAALSGAGQTFSAVIAGRALMGVGAGLLTPQSMAYITILFSERGRGTALGLWGAVAGIATATGPVITELFLNIADWRWIMWINIPLALLCFLIAVCYLPNAPGREIKITQIIMSAFYGICLGATIIGIQLISISHTLFNTGSFLMISGLLATSLLLNNDLQKKHEYILPTSLWKDDVFLRVCLISGLLGAALTAFYLPIAFLLDASLHFGPMAISIIMMTIALSNAVIGPFAGRISDRMKPTVLVRVGLILFAIANILLGLIGIISYQGNLTFIALFIAMVIAGIGTGLSFAPLANLALGRAQAASIGRAAAFFSSVRQISSALGGVIISMLFDASVRSQFGQNFLVTADNLRHSSHITALATLGCFVLIAVNLLAAAYLAHDGKKATQFNFVKGDLTA